MLVVADVVDTPVLVVADVDVPLVPAPLEEPWLLDAQLTSSVNAIAGTWNARMTTHRSHCRATTGWHAPSGR
jgi:hypothetical protein